MNALAATSSRASSGTAHLVSRAARAKRMNAATSARANHGWRGNQRKAQKPTPTAINTKAVQPRTVKIRLIGSMGPVYRISAAGARYSGQPCGWREDE